MIMDVNVKLKYKTHIVYEVMRGDFSTADVDSQVLAKKRTTLAVALAPDMRTLQQEALRELNTGMMTAAVLLPWVRAVRLRAEALHDSAQPRRE